MLIRVSENQMMGSKYFHAFGDLISPALDYIQMLLVILPQMPGPKGVAPCLSLGDQLKFQGLTPVPGHPGLPCRRKGS